MEALQIRLGFAWPARTLATTITSWWNSTPSETFVATAGTPGSKATPASWSGTPRVRTTRTTGEAGRIFAAAERRRNLPRFFFLCTLQALHVLLHVFRYNQNFRGLYCTCHRPYPDIEDAIPDDMIQCIICEDWYHGRHLELSDLRLKAPPAEKPAVSGKPRFLTRGAFGAAIKVLRFHLRQRVVGNRR